VAQSERLSGTVTFLFTDIEGSTGLLKQLGRARYGELLADQQRLLREVFAAHRGEVIDTQGDSFFVAFRSAADAISAAVESQRVLAAHPWPEGADVRVRIGIHSGEASATEERYLGFSVHRAARIGAAAHGGQVLVSDSTRSLVEDDLPEGVVLRDLGSHRLKDIDRPERISQLAAEGLQAEFPPLRRAEPVKTSPILRRRSLLAAVAAGVIAAAVAIPVFALGGGSGGSVALAGVDANAVGTVDASTGKIVASVPVGTTPGSVAFGEGSIWVTNADDHSVSRIDPRTNAAVQTIQVGSGPAGVAVCGGFVWVANNLDGTVSKIDPRTNSAVDTKQVGGGPRGVACGEHGLWVANASDGTLTRLDPRTGTLRGTVRVGSGADGVADGAGAVWVTSESSGSVARIDPRTGSVTRTTNVGSGASAVAVGAGAVWVANSLDGTVSRLDPTSNRVAATIAVGDGPSGVSVTSRGMVWVSNELAGTLSRIDPARNEVVDTVTMGNRPEGLAPTADAVYVAVRASGRTHRGGTLTATGLDTPDSIDPNASTFWEALTLTNDGLTGFRRAGGSDGARLVPDLAISLPTPTDGGRTYTFQLRRGRRYSTGALVRPADFRRAIERTLLLNPGYYGPYYGDVVGAAGCLKTPKRCDLSRGIVADPIANTITFHLTAPDPDLLYKLALPGAFAVPAGTPIKARLPLPATGPYMIAAYDPKHRLRLVRNPRFREWSAAAQPSGYPDQIEFTFVHSPQTLVRMMERGDVDFAYAVFLTPTSPSVLRTQYASQLHANPSRFTFYFALNTRVPPFDDIRVRRAINFAVNRNRMVEVAGAGFFQPSCQVLPPNFPGYQRYCPYTIDPRLDGKYTGPDLAKAKALVAASGTKGQAVTIWTSTVAQAASAGAYIVSVLKTLGYKARRKSVKNGNVYLPTIADSRRRIQAAGAGWFADYASPSNFFSVLLTCSSFHPGTTDNQNVAEFCNSRIDAEIARARSLQTSDPQAAAELWHKIDRDVADQAPWIVVGSGGLGFTFVSRRVGNYQYSPQWGSSTRCGSSRPARREALQGAALGV
jgi:YVTN family beta-propeller protein